MSDNLLSKLIADVKELKFEVKRLQTKQHYLLNEIKKHNEYYESIMK